VPLLAGRDVATAAGRPELADTILADRAEQNAAESAYGRWGVRGPAVRLPGPAGSCTARRRSWSTRSARSRPTRPARPCPGVGS